ncbi:MAG: hypothetical protein R2852_00295 [Bacteroidia bacterium]
MSPEEFDNRLKSSFQDEYLPPKEHLWANISEKLDRKARKPLWYWLLPVLIVVSASLIWIGNGFTNSKNKMAVVQENNIENITSSNVDDTETNTGNDSEASTVKTVQIIELESSHRSATSTASENVKTEKLINTNAENGSSTRVNTRHKAIENQINKPQVGFTSLNNTNNSSASAINGQNSNSSLNNIQRDFNSILNDDLNYLSLGYIGFPYFNIYFNTDNESMIAFTRPNNSSNKNQGSAKKVKNSKTDYSPDLSSKHWLSFGIGPQRAMNSLKINQDSQAWVHHHLWDNKGKMTNNGVGVQAFANYQYKFGKNNRFSFETGLNYSLRTEDIRINESSYDIAARDNDGRIKKYTPILLLLIIPNPNGGFDTTTYSAVSNFSLAVKNKYHVFTLPIRFNSEHRISTNTFFSFGLGGGMSLISSSNSEHLDMIEGSSKKQSKSTQMSASFNSRISVYTNINNSGQFGVYAGVQTYLNPWTINSNQYSIKMSDLQFGINYRLPLNF